MSIDSSIYHVLMTRPDQSTFLITFLIVYHRFSPFFTVSHRPLHSLRPFHLWVRHAKCTWSSSLSLLLSSSTKFADPLKTLIFSTSRDRLLLSNFTPRFCILYFFVIILHFFVILYFLFLFQPHIYCTKTYWRPTIPTTHLTFNG